jgi:hypothetical protein
MKKRQAGRKTPREVAAGAAAAPVRPRLPIAREQAAFTNANALHYALTHDAPKLRRLR